MSLKSDFLSIFPTPMEEMHLNPLTLMFKGQEEKIYHQTRLQKELGQKRLGMGIGILLYLVFAVADILMMPELQGLSWFFRFSFFIPLSLVAFVVSYMEFGKRYIVPISSVLLFVAGIGHISILFNAPVETVRMYHLGVLVFSIYGYFWMRTNFMITTLTLLTIWVSYFAYLFGFSPLMLSECISGAIISLIGLVLAAGGGYLLEYAQRRNYYILQGRLQDHHEEKKNAKKHKKPETVKSEEPPKPIVRTVESPVNKLFENLDDLVWFISVEGEIKYISSAAKSFLGYEPEDLIGKRAISMMVSESYQDFEDQAQRLYRDKNRVQGIFEFKTRAGLVKPGDVVMRRFQDKRFGEGYVGTTRPVAEAVVAMPTEVTAKKDKKAQEEEPKAVVAPQVNTQLMADLDDLKHVNRQLHQELEDMKGKFHLLHQELEQRTEVPMADLAEVLERMASHYSSVTKSQLLDHDKELEIISDKFNHQSMSKSDLENYLKQAKYKLHQTVNSLDLLKDRVNLYKSYLTPVEHLHLQTYTLRSILEESVLKLKQFFKNTKHVIEMDCPKNIEIATDKQLFEQVINNMIMHSLQFSFKNIRNGRIEIAVEQVDQQVFIHYKDNGDKLQSDVIDEMFARMINEDMSQVEGLELHLVRQIIENHLMGSIGCDFDLQKNSFKIVMPIKR